jgi:chromosome partitioning protein
MVSKVISVCNLKGGTGKTTTTLNLGAALANKGKRVLLIDFDAQGNLTESLGKDEEATERDIYRALRGEISLQPFEIYKGLSLVPATLDLAAAELELSAETGGSFILKELLEPVKNDYDYILIDCSPSIGSMVVNALVASELLLIPIQAEYLALRGLKKLTEVIAKVQRRLNKGLRVSGVLVTQYDGRKVLSRNVVESVEEHFKAELFDTKIRNNVALAESPTKGLDIFRYEPKSNGAEDYAALCEEVLRRHE